MHSVSIHCNSLKGFDQHYSLISAPSPHPLRFFLAYDKFDRNIERAHSIYINILKQLHKNFKSELPVYFCFFTLKIC